MIPVVDPVPGEISSAFYYEPAAKLCVRGWFVTGGRGDHVEIWLGDQRLGTAPLQLRRREAFSATGQSEMAPGWCFMTRHRLPANTPVELRCVLRDERRDWLAERTLELGPECFGDSPLELLEYEVERYEPPREGMIYEQIDLFMRSHPFYERWRGYVETHLERFNRTFAALGSLTHTGAVPDDGGVVVDLAGAPYLLPLFSETFPDREPVCLGANAPDQTFEWGRTKPIGDLDEADVDWPSASASVVTFFEVIEHLYRDPMRALSEINRILVDDGLVFITTPNITSTLAISKILRGESPYVWRQYQPFGGRRHVNEFAPDDLRLLMQAAGFEVRLWTENCYIDDVDPAFEALLDRWGCPTAHRGDTIFAVGRKIGPVRNRYPEPMYCQDNVRLAKKT